MKYLVLLLLLVLFFAIPVSRYKNRLIVNQQNDGSNSVPQPASEAKIKSFFVSGNANGSPITVEESTGDLWFSTWADDNNLYITWGDGKGFGATLSDVGIARLSGDPPFFNGSNIYNEKHPGVLGILDNDKPSSLIFINGRLYAHFFSPLARPRIGYNAHSDDYGKTWIKVGSGGKNNADEESPWTSENNSKFRCLFFVNMGMNYNLNTDGFVYAYGIPQPGSWSGEVYLSRVKKEKIINYDAYEYFAGMAEGKPAWSEKEEDAIKVPNLYSKGQFSVAYHAGIQRFLLMTSEDLYEAPNPWGEWLYVGNWKEKAGESWVGGYQPGIISKDMGQNYFWFTISGQPEKGSRVDYKLNIGKIIMSVDW